MFRSCLFRCKSISHHTQFLKHFSSGASLENTTCFGSSIILPDHVHTLNQYISLSPVHHNINIDVSKHMKLVYQASQVNNGLSSETFHSKCDNKSSLVLVFRTEFENIFCGFSSIGWRDTHITSSSSTQTQNTNTNTNSNTNTNRNYTTTDENAFLLPLHLNDSDSVSSDVSISSQLIENNINNLTDFEQINKIIESNTISFKNSSFRVLDYEVFELSEFEANWHYCNLWIDNEKHVSNETKFGRTDKQWFDYGIHRDRVLSKYETMGDFILGEKFGFNSITTENDRLKVTVTDEMIKSKEYLFDVNDFPYHLEESIDHHLIFCVVPLTVQETNDIIKKQDIFKNRDVLWWVNPTHMQSIPTLWHCQILSRPKHY